MKANVGDSSISNEGKKAAKKRSSKPVEEVKEPLASNDAMFEMEEDEPIQGNFETDVPERVIGAKMSQGMIHVTIEWKPRKNGVKPQESVFSNEDVKQRCPKLLVDFYESRINARQRQDNQ